jgi:ABC-type dipeptide/oligopeptide/nickel transport system permease subunit
VFGYAILAEAAFVLVMAINLLGDGLREIIDPRLERAERI